MKLLLANSAESQKPSLLFSNIKRFIYCDYLTYLSEVGTIMFTCVMIYKLLPPITI